MGKTLPPSQKWRPRGPPLCLRLADAPGAQAPKHAQLEWDAAREELRLCRIRALPVPAQLCLCADLFPRGPFLRRKPPLHVQKTFWVTVASLVRAIDFIADLSAPEKRSLVTLGRFGCN